MNLYSPDPALLMLCLFGLYLAINLSVLIVKRLNQLYKWDSCDHELTRCIHGDEINYYTKVYYFRFWKGSEVRRQVCISCGKPLNRPPICQNGSGIHQAHNPKGIS